MKSFEQIYNDKIVEHEEKIRRLRDEFAKEAMGEIINIANMRGWGWKTEEEFYENIAKKAYIAADAMLKAREVNP